MPHIIKTKDTPGISLRYQRRLEGGQTHLPVRKNLHKKNNHWFLSLVIYFITEMNVNLVLIK